MVCIIAVMASSPVYAQYDNRQQVVGVARGDSLNIREGAGAGFKDIGNIKRNQYVSVLGYDNTGRWVKVLWQGREGWVAAKYLSGGIGGNKSLFNQPRQTYDGPNNLGPHIVYNVPNNDPLSGLAVRSGPGIDFKLEQVIANTIEIFVISINRNGRWAFIRFSNGTGYVSTKFIQPVGRRNGNQQQTGNGNQNVQGSNDFLAQTTISAPDGLSLPAVFSVVNVAQGDFLHGRKAPNVSAPILKSFAPDTPIVVFAYLVNGWAKVGVGEEVVYVSSRFIKPNGGVQTSSGMQLGLVCRGIEPFWTVKIDEDQSFRYEGLIGGAEPRTSINRAIPSTNTNSYPYNFGAMPYSGTISQEICSDGMSNINYGWRITLIKPTQSGSWKTLNGCCSLSEF